MTYDLQPKGNQQCAVVRILVLLRQQDCVQRAGVLHPAFGNWFLLTQRHRSVLAHMGRIVCLSWIVSFSKFVLSVKVISSSGKLCALFVQSLEQRDHSQAPRHHRSAAMNDPFSNCTDHTGELPLGCFQTGHMHITLTIDFLWLL